MKLILKTIFFLLAIILIFSFYLGKLNYDNWLTDLFLDTEKKEIKEDIKESKTLYTSPLTGEQLEEDLANKTPVAVVIDNQIDALPQSGLNEACLIYEIPTEGGITRFLAFFQQKFPSKIGPVRSLRLAFLDIAPEYEALLVHAGGDSRALKKVRSEINRYRNLDQFQNSKYFWREKNKIAPHNLYTSGTNLQKALQDKNWEYLTKNFSPFNFTSPATEKGTVREIKVKYPSNLYSSVWNYDEEKNLYLRLQNGKPHLDELSGENLHTKNLLVLITKGVVATKLNHLDLDLIGEGKAFLFNNGYVFEGRWRKTSPESRLELFNLEGKPLDFIPGKIWISILTEENKLKY